MGCAGMHRDVMSSKNFGSSEDGINMAAQSMKKALMTGKVDRNTVRRDRRETVCESFLRTVVSDYRKFPGRAIFLLEALK